MTVLLALAACDSAALRTTLGGVTLEPDAEVSSVVRVGWDPSVQGTAWAEYGLDGELGTESPTVVAEELTLLGLKAGREYTVVVHVADGDGVEWVSEPATVQLAAAPSELPLFTVTDVDEAAWEGDGFLLTSVISAGPSWVVIVDRDGDYVWWTEGAHGPILGVERSADGRRLTWLENNPGEDGADGGARTRALDLSGNSFAEGVSAHHASLELPDGRVAWIGYETRTVELADRTITVTADTILEADADAVGEPSTRWSFLDDYPHGVWNVCHHASEEGYDAGAGDLTHGNSLMYDEAQDDFLFMARNLDALMRIDRQTGELIWQIGGKYGEFDDVAGDTVDPDDAAEVDGPAQTWWSHGHMSHWWDGGFAVFDNGYHHADKQSRAVVYAYDEAARTITRGRTYESDAHDFEGVLGDAKLLSGGDLLVTWTLTGVIEEVDPAGRAVWRASVELGHTFGRTTYFDSLYP